MEQLVAGLRTELQRARAELQQVRAATLGAMLGPLRLRETVLLYVGNEGEAQFSERLAQEFGSDIADQALRYMYVLNNAPLPGEQTEALRAAFNKGVSRW